VAGTLVTLLLSAWAAAASPVGIFAEQGFSGKVSSAPGEDYGTPAADNERKLELPHAPTDPGDERLAAVLTFGLKVILVAVVVILLVAVARAARESLARRTLAGRSALTPGEVVPDALLEAAREGEQLIERGTPANAVVAAWVRLEDAARDAGVRDDRARTSAELAHAVLRSFRVDGDALEELAGLYREARFSSHPLGEDVRTRARAALRQVTTDLARALPAGARQHSTSGAAR